MATFVYDAAMLGVAQGTINLQNDTFKWMLVTSSYSAAKTDTTVTAAAAAEITATGYNGGFNQAGRLTALRTVSTDTVANIVKVVFNSNATWSGLGGSTNSTIAAAVLIKEITNDASSKPIAYFGLTVPVTTNTSAFSLLIDSSSGNITFQL